MGSVGGVAGGGHSAQRQDAVVGGWVIEMVRGQNHDAVSLFDACLGQCSRNATDAGVELGVSHRAAFVIHLPVLRRHATN